jgi:alpha-ketoglutarate-dependent taurine dioxygenase
MLQIRRMGPCIGGEVSGVDVRELDGDSFAPIYRAWLTFGVIVVRGQKLKIPISSATAGVLAWSWRIPPNPPGIRTIPS